jgi:hypothetical protein
MKWFSYMGTRASNTRMISVALLRKQLLLYAKVLLASMLTKLQAHLIIIRNTGPNKWKRNQHYKKNWLVPHMV